MECAEVARVRVDDMLAEQDPWAVVLPREQQVIAAAEQKKKLAKKKKPLLSESEDDEAAERDTAKDELHSKLQY